MIFKMLIEMVINKLLLLFKKKSNLTNLVFEVKFGPSAFKQRSLNAAFNQLGFFWSIKFLASKQFFPSAKCLLDKKKSFVEVRIFQESQRKRS
jgi:hypothetical protein